MKNGIMNRPVEQVISQPTSNPLDAPIKEFQAGLSRRKENRTVLMDWIKSSLVKNQDYGSIIINGNPSKPSLFKPGAEKICGMLGLIPQFPNLHKYEELALSGKEIVNIILKCELANQAGRVIATGVGARNVDKQDQGNLNKALKMSAKSAVIDATLRCAGLSEIFTQDVEDMEFQDSEPNIPNKDDDNKCTNKQFTTMLWLRDHPHVTEEESHKIGTLLDKGPSREEAFSTLEYFLGKSKRDPVTGQWIKEDVGILEKRQSDDIPD